MKGQKVVVRILMEVVGSPKEHVQTVLAQLSDKMKQEKYVTILKDEPVKPAPVDDKFWSAFTEAEIELQDFNDLTKLIYDYTPSTIEILEPAGMEMDMTHMTDFLNDQLARVHQMVGILKNKDAERVLMIKKLNDMAVLLKQNNIEFNPTLGENTVKDGQKKS